MQKQEIITTKDVINLFRKFDLPCDAITVSCLARQGRFSARKIGTNWVFDKGSVLDDILCLKVQRQKNMEETDADQQT